MRGPLTDEQVREYATKWAGESHWCRMATELLALRGLIEGAREVLGDYQISSADGEDYNNEDVIDMCGKIDAALNQSAEPERT
jgi:hypothetical protein